MNLSLDDSSIALRPTVIDVDLDALRRNIEGVRARVGEARIMGTVKANAYGHGLVRTATEMLRSGVDELGVAFLEEGIELRRAGVTAPILVLGGIIGNQISHRGFKGTSANQGFQGSSDWFVHIRFYSIHHRIDGNRLLLISGKFFLE